MKVEIKLEKSRRQKVLRNKGLETCDIDTEEFSKAVQDLGLEVIDAGIETPIDIIPVRKVEPTKQTRFNRFNLTASAKRALSSMVSRREKKIKRHGKIKISLDDFPQVPDHPIAA